MAPSWIVVAAVLFSRDLPRTPGVSVKDQQGGSQKCDKKE